MQVRGVLETCLYVADIPAARHFYGDILGLELTSGDDNRFLFFNCGEAKLYLFNPAETVGQEIVVGGNVIPRHGSTGAGHVAFRATLDELDGWKTHLIAHHVEIESEVDWGDGTHSLYFRDPVGNSLEFKST